MVLHNFFKVEHKSKKWTVTTNSPHGYFDIVVNKNPNTCGEGGSLLISDQDGIHIEWEK